jgi:hypothetical protein
MSVSNFHITNLLYSVHLYVVVLLLYPELLLVLDTRKISLTAIPRILAYAILRK